MSVTRNASAEAVSWVVVVAVAVVVAAVGAQSAVGGWNDGSRLASVESLVDRHTWSIDDSFLVRRDAEAPPDQLVAVPVLTLDKLSIKGRFYSDKPPLPALWMAGAYALWREAGGAPARLAPQRFCYWMTLVTSGLGYVVAVAAIFGFGGVIGLAPPTRLLLTASFAFATLALPYSRSVNGHMMLLAVAAVLFLHLTRAARDTRSNWLSWGIAGALSGLAYTIDLAAGPLLLVCIGIYVAVQGGRRAVVVFGGAALPWLVTHHAITWAIGNTLLPLNAEARYVDWPGSPFAGRLTGAWHHDGVLDAATYGLALLIGKRGFLLHNPPLLLALAGLAHLWRQAGRESALLIAGMSWAAATWLACALASNNYAGECASIRWLVPLLAPGYLALALLLRERRDWLVYLGVLGIAGMALALPMWWRGPWNGRMVPGFWAVQTATLAACVIARHRRTVSSPQR